MNGTKNTVRNFLIRYPFGSVLGFALLVFCLDLGNREPLSYEFRHGVILRYWLEKGFSWIPTLLDVPYAQKPPLFFWLMFPLAKLCNSFSLTFLVLPSALSGVGTVCLIYFFLKRLNLSWALLSSFILITMFPFYLKARMSTADMLFVFCLTLTLIGFFSFYVRHQKWGIWGLVLGLLAGWFVKGPLGVILPSAIIVLYLGLRKDWKNVLVYGGSLALFFALCFVSWYGLCYYLLGEEFVTFALQSHTYGRVVEPPNQPFYYYLSVILVMGLPWSFFLLGIFREKIKRENKEMFSLEMIELERFVFIWFSVIFLLFTIVSVKHLRYILPVFPPMAILAASFWIGQNEEDSWKKFFWKVVPTLLWSTVLLICVGLCIWPFLPQTAILKEWPLRYGIVVGAILIFFFIEIRRIRKKRLFQTTSLFMALLCLQLFHAQFITPTISYEKSPKELVLQFEKVNKRQNPLGFYQFDRTDLFRYIYYSTYRLVFPMQLFEPEKIIPTMKHMKYKRGHFVTYRRKYNPLPEAIKKDCVIMQEIPFRDEVWVNAKWRDPAYP